MYKKVSVFIYKNKEQEQPEIRVFDSETRCPNYEAILLSMFNNKIRIFELDTKVESMNTTMTGTGMVASRTTELGRDFIQYITNNSNKHS